MLIAEELGAATCTGIIKIECNARLRGSLAEPIDGLRNEMLVDLMNLDPNPQPVQQRDREFATEMLAKLLQAAQQRGPAAGIARPSTSGGRSAAQEPEAGRRRGASSPSVR